MTSGPSPPGVRPESRVTVGLHITLELSLCIEGNTHESSISGRILLPLPDNKAAPKTSRVHLIGQDMFSTDLASQGEKCPLSLAVVTPAALGLEPKRR